MKKAELIAKWEKELEEIEKIHGWASIPTERDKAWLLDQARVIKHFIQDLKQLEESEKK